MARLHDLEARVAQARTATECRDALIELANQHAAEFRNREGLRAARNALNIARAHDDPVGVGRALAAATLCHYQRGDYASAVASGLDAIDAYASEDPGGRSSALRSIALALCSVEAHPLAEAAARRAVEDAVQAADPERGALARAVLAIILGERGRFGEARAVFREAAAMHRTLGDTQRLKKVVSNIGHTHRRQANASEAAGRAPQARRHWRQALRLYRVALRIGDGVADEEIIRGAMAECHFRLGELDDAESQVRLALAQGVTSPVVVAPCRLWESHILEARGDLRAAERACARAREAAEMMEPSGILVECLRTQSHLNDLMGRFETAADLERRAREVALEREAQLTRMRQELAPLWDRCTAAPLAGNRRAA